MSVLLLPIPALCFIIWTHLNAKNGYLVAIPAGMLVCFVLASRILLGNIKNNIKDSPLVLNLPYKLQQKEPKHLKCFQILSIIILGVTIKFFSIGSMILCEDIISLLPQFPVNYPFIAGQRALTGSRIIDNIIFLCIIPAVCEEYYFRHKIGQLLLQTRCSPIMICCVSSLLFGIIHLSPTQAFHAALSGCLLMLIYLKGYGLASVILAHFCGNMLVEFGTLTQVLILQDKVVQIIITIACMLITTSLLCYIAKENRYGFQNY